MRRRVLQAAVKASASAVVAPTTPASNGPGDQRHAVASPSEKPQSEPLIHRYHRDYLQVSFDRLASYACDAPEGVEEDPHTAMRRLAALIPASLRALDGRSVAVEGFMLPTMASKDRVTGFVLLKDQMGCCFGIAPAMNGWVFVTMAGHKTVEPTMDVSITVYGTLSVGPAPAGEAGMSLYRLVADGVEAPKPPSVWTFGN